MGNSTSSMRELCVSICLWGGVKDDRTAARYTAALVLSSGTTTMKSVGVSLISRRLLDINTNIHIHKPTDCILHTPIHPLVRPL